MPIQLVLHHPELLLSFSEQLESLVTAMSQSAFFVLLQSCYRLTTALRKRLSAVLRGFQASGAMCPGFGDGRDTVASQVIQAALLDFAERIRRQLSNHIAECVLVTFVWCRRFLFRSVEEIR